MTNHNHWIPLSAPYDKGMAEIQLQQYHAAQFLAMAGRFLIPKKEDDSHTNFRFVPEMRMYVGSELTDGKRLALGLDHLTLHVLDGHMNTITKSALEGITLEEAFKELIYLLAYVNINIDNLKYELHYETLDHSLKNGSVFNINSRVLNREIFAHRHNAKLVLEMMISDFDQASPPRIWPHHFDTGTIIPLRYNKRGDIETSIGLGWAIADELVDEPYYYLSFWSSKSAYLPTNMPGLEAGQWMLPGWNGATLRLSEILEYASPEKQKEHVVRFFQSGLKSIKQSFNNSGVSIS